MNKIAILILNYKTWELTIDLIENIRETPEFNKICDIIVVDNCSPNDSYEQLEHEKEKLDYILIKSFANAGYAAGNNIGLKYAHTKGYEYALVVNNDIIFDDVEFISKMLRVFEKAEDVAVVSPDIYMPDGYMCNRDIIRPNAWDMSLGALSYRKKGRGNPDKEDFWMYSYRPQGCCMLVNLMKMNQVHFMDEFTFLYCEEMILAERLLAIGYRCACCIATHVIHDHSFTVKSSLSKWKFIISNLRSYNYYLKRYREFWLLKRWWCDFFYVIKLFATKQL